MDGKAGTTLFLHEVSGIGASRVLLVGLGKQDAFSQKAYGEAVRAAWRALLGTKIVQVTFTLAQLPVLERTTDWCVRAAILALRELTYRFTQMKSKQDNTPRALKRIVFSVNTGDEKAAKLAARQGAALANGMSFHGGFLGVTLAMMLFAYQRKRSWLQVTDFVAPMVPTGLAAGRLGNFINGELWGRVTEPSAPWAMLFPGAAPDDATWLAAHPQLAAQWHLNEVFAQYHMSNSMACAWPTGSRCRSHGAAR